MKRCESKCATHTSYHQFFGYSFRYWIIINNKNLILVFSELLTPKRPLNHGWSAAYRVNIYRCYKNINVYAFTTFRQFSNIERIMFKFDSGGWRYSANAIIAATAAGVAAAATTAVTTISTDLSKPWFLLWDSLVLSKVNWFCWRERPHEYSNPDRLVHVCGEYFWWKFAVSSWVNFAYSKLLLNTQTKRKIKFH